MAGTAGSVSQAQTVLVRRSTIIGTIVLALVAWYLGRLGFPAWLSLPPSLRPIAIILATALTVFPIIWTIYHFKKTGQKIRMDQIRGVYNADVIVEYFTRFWPGRDGFSQAISNYKSGTRHPGDAEKALRAKFDELLLETFGDRRFGVAIIFLTITSSTVIYYAIRGGFDLATHAADATPSSWFLSVKPNLVGIAAIFGAYTWVTSDVIQKYRLNDFASSDLYWYALRFIVATPLGLAIAAFSGAKGTEEAIPKDGNWGAVFAFVISMFSLTGIQQMLGALLTRATGVTPPGPAAGTQNDVCIKLPDVDQRLADRFADEGVTTIGQVATMDPVRLSSRTNQNFNFVLQLIDRAILWDTVGAKLLDLQIYGWGSASQIIDYVERRDGANRPKILQAADILAKTEVSLRDANAARDAAAYELAQAEQRVEGAEAALARLPIESPGRQQAEAELGAARTGAMNSRAALTVADEQVQTIIREVTDAMSALSALVSPSNDALIDAIATATNIAAPALHDLAAKVSTNEYARFIRRLMKVSPTFSAAKATVHEKAAVPI